ncbi:MAG: hypothetical protein ABJH52_01120 [Henriciella sp.]
MKTLQYFSAAALAAGLIGSFAAQASAQNANGFKNAMQNASQARLNYNGSNVLRFDADQDLTVRNTLVSNSSLRANSVHVDDSLISNLDVDQDATVRNSVMTSSTVSLNAVDMTRARSITTDIDQDVSVRNVTARNASVAANTITVR